MDAVGSLGAWPSLALALALALVTVYTALALTAAGVVLRRRDV
ncbi:hypothetical protein GCM10009601_22180 [Streptomyces thermospinosisporus]|uniref:ABC transporter permease n=1 Tax=Streptomyces thermospinosisporus TaxID=161482 RepID=A0ABN1YT99_9ACTN